MINNQQDYLEQKYKISGVDYRVAMVSRLYSMLTEIYAEGFNSLGLF